jgi:cephalosporin-C deacetylase
MPIEELRSYMGSSPRPVDFDSFWGDALKEMRDVDPKVELEPAKFKAPGADCFNLFFTGVGGARIRAKYLKPHKFSNPMPCVLQFHGYTASSGEWFSKLAFLNMGMAVAALDCRGQGGMSEDSGCVKGNTQQGHIIRGLSESPEKLLFRQIFLDAAQLAGIVMSFSEIDEERIAAMGGSQGGGLTLACAALEPGIKLIAPWVPFLCDYKRVWEMDLDVDAYLELKKYFRMFDPLHENESEIFTRLGYIDVQNLAGRIKAEVLWGIGLLDSICPPSTQFAAYNKINSKKEMKVYPDFGHEGLSGFEDLAYQFISRLC